MLNANDKFVFRQKVKENEKVLTLNGIVLPKTLNKSDDFYDGYEEGFRRAIAMMEGRR